MQKTNVEQFLSMGDVVVDVRSPIEFAQGHIPGAINLPLFSDEEREQVGTLYKRKGRQEALELGLEFVGPKMVEIVRSVREVVSGEDVLVHCFRGGMRSQSVAWLLELCGFRVTVLEGGYKAFRSWILERFTENYPFRVLGGLTGSAKTEVLHALDVLGEVVIDLEGRAEHKGSAFGALGCVEQPTQVQFENLLGMDLWRAKDATSIWIEDESRTVGKRVVPEKIWKQMRVRDVLFLERTIEERVEHLMHGYGDFSGTALRECAEKIRKRFGPDRTSELLRLIDVGNIREAITMVLTYYDKGYLHGLSKRSAQCIDRFFVSSLKHEDIAVQLLEYVQR
jgi:tRNA 2-selenouridine synthase